MIFQMLFVSLNPSFFADDSAVCYSFLDSLTSTINNELAQLSDWFKANKVSLNSAKTNFILIEKITYR